MTINRIKIFATLALVLPVLALMISYRTTPVSAVTLTVSDPAEVFKAKCAMCHSPKAEKLYNPALPQEEQIEAILKGKKGEKPPNMPAFEPKGMTADDAKALVEY